MKHLENLCKAMVKLQSIIAMNTTMTNILLALLIKKHERRLSE